VDSNLATARAQVVEPFTMVPNWLLALGLHPSTLRVATQLLFYGAGRDGICRPRVSTLARASGLSPRMVIYHLRELERRGVLQTTQKPGRSSWYKIDHPCNGLHPTPPVIHRHPCNELQTHLNKKGKKMELEDSGRGPAPPAARKAIQNRPVRDMNRRPLSIDERLLAKQASELIRRLDQNPGLQAQGFRAGTWWGKKLREERNRIVLLETIALLARHILEKGTPDNAWALCERTYQEKRATFWARKSEADQQSWREAPTIFDALRLQEAKAPHVEL